MFLAHLLLLQVCHSFSSETTLDSKQTTEWLQHVHVVIFVHAVQQLLAVSKELQVRGRVDEGAGLSWGEFCVCCVELLELKHTNTPSSTGGGGTVR